ncbi:TetR/AcrR family transcriptional regulator [Ekhidna lutea]|nr:TetR/AcrR family transcriptional regulator [Ekhidna lutea]
MLDKKEKVLSEAFNRFVKDGVKNTTIEKIAQDLQMSKKTIYLMFRTKEDLLIASFQWKLDHMAKMGEGIAMAEMEVVSKLLALLEAIHLELKDITMNGLFSAYPFKSRTSSILEDYLRGAVFVRFKKIFEQCHSEGLVDSKVDVNSTMLMYWETLSMFIFARPAGRPTEVTITRPFNEHLNIQLINFFRGFLNAEGIKKFDQELANHPLLKGFYA